MRQKAGFAWREACLAKTMLSKKLINFFNTLKDVQQPSPNLYAYTVLLWFFLIVP
jgi:hypothetical protein